MMVGIALVAGVGVVLLALSQKRRFGRTGRYPQGNQYGTWTSVRGGMNRPFFTTGWFLLWTIIVVGLWLVLTWN